ncbi:MAG: hypothetical protein AAGA10_13250 [Bacteroidota bacterium]
MKILSRVLGMFCLGVMLTGHVALGQEGPFSIQIEPESPRMQVGDELQLTVRVIDGEGKEVKDPSLRFFSRGRKIVGADRSSGMLTAMDGGEAQVIVMYSPPSQQRSDRVRKDITVSVAFPPLKEIQFVDLPSKIFVGTSIPLSLKVIDEKNNIRKDLIPQVVSQNIAVAQTDAFNNLLPLATGKCLIQAEIEGIDVAQEIEVLPNPVVEISLASEQTQARTGDVIAFDALTKDKGGNEISDVPVLFTFQGKADNPSYTAGGMIEQDGRFVAYEPGMYQVTATCGNLSATKAVKITKRDIQKPIEFIGRGSVTNVHTSDLWVWEGVDGRDYAVTGTWGADGEAYFWDVTDPASIQIIDTFKVDARTVNDVKVSEDGTVCIISREGASNRKNGIVILDVTDPTNVTQHAVFDEGLTGGVHNLFIYQDHVYALSNGERYDIINIEDPKKPEKVGTFELDTPGHSIHDVWIEDGIAYSSNWSNGVQMVDVGNGMRGGSPSNPVKISSYAYPSGWNHAAFPFKSPSTDKFYVIGGDEAFPRGININDNPTYPAGYLHVIDFSDLDNPKEVAHYEVPDAGSHNFWIEGETLYVANYNGGLRIVDISGDLMGDIFKQGREIAWFKPTDPKGRVPNAPMTWGPQPHKGHIFFSDWNSGIWAVKMKSPEKPTQ